MDRRNFLQIAGLAGLAVVAPLGISRVRAESARYGGPFWIMVNAGGGWDPTMLCDPKGGTASDKTSIDQAYTTAQIGKAGNIHYPQINAVAGGDMVEIFSCQRFFDAHHADLMVLNGLDTTTNNHDAGSRTVWSGQLSEGYPSLAALIAGVVYADKPVPMAYLSSGGFDATEGVVSLTRAGNIGTLQKAAHPNVMNPSDTKSDLYNSNETASRIVASQQGRLKALQNANRLPGAGTAMSSLFLARQGNDGLAALANEFMGKQIVTLDDIPDFSGKDTNGLGDLQDLMQQAQIACYAFKAGVAVSANLNIGGFDTHSDHDNRQGSQMMKLLRGLDYLYSQITALGLGGKVYVVVGSDFGRTPYYNNGNGKDHWNLTSMLMSGPGIAGDRVVGGSDKDFKPMNFNKTSLAADPSGLRINTNHVHLALRKLAKIDTSALAGTYGLPGDHLPFFA